MSEYITIPGFESLSKQEIFDISVKHVLKNGKPSLSFAETCCYSGIGCAAAPFIRKEKRYEAEGLSWNSLRDDGLVPSHQSSFVRELQTCHDSNANEDNFIEEFRKSVFILARSHNLNTNVLEDNQ